MHGLNDFRVVNYMVFWVRNFYNFFYEFLKKKIFFPGPPRAAAPHPLLRRGRQAAADRVARPEPAVHERRAGLAELRAQPGLAGEESDEPVHPGGLAEAAADHGAVVFDDAGEGLGRRPDGTYRRDVCANVVDEGQEDGEIYVCIADGEEKGCTCWVRQGLYSTFPPYPDTRLND